MRSYSRDFGETKSALGERKRDFRSMFYYVYVLMCLDKKTYVGCTDNLRERIERHRKGYVDATNNRLPVKLYAYFAFGDKYVAFNFEEYLKSGSGRAFLKKHIFKH